MSPKISGFTVLQKGKEGVHQQMVHRYRYAIATGELPTNLVYFLTFFTDFFTNKSRALTAYRNSSTRCPITIPVS